jgi:hypothetical protein
MKHLILLNDPPYGTERSFDGLRMARMRWRRTTRKPKSPSS